MALVESSTMELQKKCLPWRMVSCSPVDFRGADADSNLLGMMEAQHAANPNLNPLCGKLATVYLEGKSVIVKLVDTCADCVSLFPL